MIIIIGHKNPDTDSIVSVLVYANLKSKLGEKVKPCRLGALNKETKFVLSRFKAEWPDVIKSVAGKQVILLDHGDSSNSAPGLNKAEILEVIDHHFIGDIQTIKPILYRAEPIGSTSTIIAKIAKEKNIKLNKKQAGLLLSGIISDTICFSGPTTTEEDIKIGRKLARIAKIKSKDLAQKMFEARSSIKGLSAQDIVGGDYKEHKFGGVKLDVSVFETLTPEKLKPWKTKMFNALRKLKKEKKAGLLFFLVIDILKKNSFLYLIDKKEKEVAKKVFGGPIEKEIMFLQGVASRKKQIIPPLAQFLEKSAKRG